MNIEIADIVFSISCDMPVQSIRLEDDYKEFLSARVPEVFVRGHYFVEPDISLRDEDKVFESGVFWDVYKVDSRFAFALKIPVQGSSPYCIAVFEDDFRYGDVYQLISHSGETYNDSLTHPLAFPLFHLLTMSFLAQGHGLLIHSCGIDDNGRGFLFPGSSTQGKTTMARLWQNDAVILNDERIVLRQRDGRLWIYGTPWHGEHNGFSPRGVPLDKVFFLQKAEINRINRPEGSNAVAMLLSHCFLPMWDEKGMCFTLDFCTLLANNIPCYELGFAPDENIVEFVRSID